MIEALAVLLGGTTSGRPTRSRRQDDGKHKTSTNDLVVCTHCEAVCEPTKSTGAKSQAIFSGWKKLSEREFVCPECRKEDVKR